MKNYKTQLETKRQRATKLILDFNIETMSKNEIYKLCTMSDNEFKYYFKNNMPQIEKRVIEQSKELQEFYKL